MRQFLRRWLIDPLVTLLSQGITPAKIALSLAIGIGLGIFPVLGTTTVLVTIAALVWRLNLIAIHTVHYALTPLQLLLIIPFVRLGEHVVGAAPQPLSLSAGQDLLAHGALHAAVVLWGAIVHAVIGWLAVGPLLIWLLYLGSKPLLERAAQNLGGARANGTVA